MAVPTTTERVAAVYLVAQAAVGVGLWVAAGASTTFRSWVELVPSTPAMTGSFLLPDLALVVASLLGAWAIATRRAWAIVVVAATAGGFAYPTLYLAAWVAREGTGSLALAMMIVPLTMNAWIAFELWRRRGAGDQVQSSTTSRSM